MGSKTKEIAKLNNDIGQQQSNAAKEFTFKCEHMEKKK